MSSTNTVNLSPVLHYLGLPDDYLPSPDAQPVEFLVRHLHQLPPHLLTLMSSIVTPKQRSTIPAIRNRRKTFAETDPLELGFLNAKATWPTMWPGRERPGQSEAEEEREWAQEFLGGLKKHVGKLGTLLGGYEEERVAERVRTLRREQAEQAEALPEEDEDTDDEEETEPQADTEEELTQEELRTLFIRRVREAFIYGLLESIDYDIVDWDDKWDVENDRDAEERWFDDDDEEEGTDIA